MALKHCLLLTALLLSVFLPRYPLVAGKEIEATHEWTLVGEDDTVAAGMHVRMDLTTGEKWVKLPDDSESDQPSPQGVELQVLPDGETAVLEPQYDFDMMYRALSNLPDDEKKRIGLPDLPETDDERKVFEATMAKIWEDRQEALQYQAKTADLPQILKDRIEGLKSYIQDPSFFLLERPVDVPGEESLGNAEDDDEEEFRTIDPTNTIAVLEDLEFLLQDIDMARDFHTLGGWELLVSFLDKDTHKLVVSANTTQEDFEAASYKVHSLERYAMWAMGTAVKNTGEFTPYVLEHHGASTPLDLVFNQVSQYDASVSDPVTQKKIMKALYCLGSFLRGNLVAQRYFYEIGGPTWVAKAIAIGNERHGFHASVQARLLNLLSDCASESKDNGNTQYWVLGDVCSSILGVSTDRGGLEPLANTLRVFVDLCPWDQLSLLKLLDRIENTWHQESGVDSDVQNERLQGIATVRSLVHERVD